MSRQRPLGLDSRRGEDRAVSTTIGVVLIVGIVVLLSAVAGMFFIGIGTGQPSDVPDVSASIEYDDGGDGTFSDPGNGGPCAGGTYDDDDSFAITFAAAETVEENNFTVKVDSTEVTFPGCAGGKANSVHWLVSPTDLQAGKTIEAADGDANNAISPGQPSRSSGTPRTPTNRTSYSRRPSPTAELTLRNFGPSTPVRHCRSWFFQIAPGFSGWNSVTRTLGVWRPIEVTPSRDVIGRYGRSRRNKM